MSEIYITSESLWRRACRLFRSGCFDALPEPLFIETAEIVAALNSAGDGKNETRDYVVLGL